MDKDSTDTADQTGSVQTTTAPRELDQNITAQTGATANVPTLQGNVFYSTVNIHMHETKHQGSSGSSGEGNVINASSADSSTTTRAPPAVYLAQNINIMDFSTSGAGQLTSNQLGNRHLLGVPASHALAEEDAGRMLSYKNSILSVGHKTGIDPAVIAAIISRASRAGNVLEQDGWDRGRQVFGIMQVHRVNHPEGGKDSEQHMIQATGLLQSFIQSMDSSWSPELRYKGGIAAYNCGPGAVTSPNVDQNTTGKDYSNDVIARAQWFKCLGY